MNEQSEDGGIELAEIGAIQKVWRPAPFPMTRINARSSTPQLVVDSGRCSIPRMSDNVHEAKCAAMGRMMNKSTRDTFQISPANWHCVAATDPGSVLLLTARSDGENRKTYLFTGAERILTAHKLDEIPKVFQDLENALRSGYFVCGFLTYEAGYHFEPSAISSFPLPPAPGLPLVWFGVYAEPLILDESDAQKIEYCPEMEGAFERDPDSVDISRTEYFDRIQQIRRYIESGDLYQANFTVMVRQRWGHGAARLFEKIMNNQPVPYGALINTGQAQILSASPELFFRKHGTQILVRPMKGTCPRGRDLGEDCERAAWLAADEKNCAENLMIVDLLRNDLGRICRTGSISVPDLFSVQRYPDLLQMTSTVGGDLKPETSYYDIFRSLFPCGSITGAPKIRTMQVIRELEKESRGIACGAIGFISPKDEAVFSVAIRTLTLRDNQLTMRVGSGVTYDSDPEAEYEECLLKAKFLFPSLSQFSLIETMLWDQDYFLLDLHLDRLAASAKYLDFFFDLEGARDQLERVCTEFESGTRHRVRILLSRSGAVSTASEALSETPDSVSLMLSAERTDSGDPLLRHKTTRRMMYDRVYASALGHGFDDALFLNERGEVTECAIHNLMIARDGILLTPPVACGLLPGVYRRHLLSTHSEIHEAPLTIEDLVLADGIFVFNSVRGLRPVSVLKESGRTIVQNDGPRMQLPPGFRLLNGIDVAPKGR